MIVAGKDEGSDSQNHLLEETEPFDRGETVERWGVQIVTDTVEE